MTNLDLMYMNSKFTVYQHQKDYSDGIADGKNNAYSRLAQWLNRLKAQQEEMDKCLIWHQEH